MYLPFYKFVWIFFAPLRNFSEVFEPPITPPFLADNLNTSSVVSLNVVLKKSNYSELNGYLHEILRIPFSPVVQAVEKPILIPASAR